MRSAVITMSLAASLAGWPMFFEHGGHEFKPNSTSPPLKRWATRPRTDGRSVGGELFGDHVASY